MARTSRKTAWTGAAGQPAQPERIYQTAAYVRLSVEDNNRAGDGDSIFMQQHMLERYISMQPDMVLQGIYVDNGETGTSFARPGFERMMDCVRERAVDCIVVKDLSRFGRNYVEAGYYLGKIFPYLGVRFVAVNDQYDTAGDGGSDELVLSLKNLVNDLYAKDISQKVSSALGTKQKKGEFIGAFPPYGYLKSPQDKHRLVLDPETAPVVRRIFQWRLEGLGIAQAARRLNEEKIPCPAMYQYIKGYKKKKPSGAGAIWQAQGIKALTRNPVYAGHMAQGKHRKSLSSGIPTKAVPDSEWILVEHTHEAAVSQEVFDRVQEITRQRHDACCARSGKYASTENIFKGLLVCGDCGTKMIRYKDVSRAGTVRYTFICPVYAQNLGTQGCTLKSIGEPELKEAVLHTLRLEVEAALDLEKMLERLQAQEGFREKCRGLDAGISRLQQEIKRNAMLRGTLFESYSDGMLTEREYLSMKTAYDRESGDLKEKLAGLEKEKHRCTCMLTPQNRWITALKEYRTEEAVSRSMVEELIQKIYVTKRDEIRIVWNFQDEFVRLAVEAEREGAGK